MDSALTEFLSRHRCMVQETAVWGGGTLPLRINSYLSAEQPPFDYVTSVRAVVLQCNAVLVIRDAENSFHVTPAAGGKRTSQSRQRCIVRF
jgi:hypothetical protein